MPDSITAAVPVPLDARQAGAGLTGQMTRREFLYTLTAGAAALTAAACGGGSGAPPGSNQPPVWQTLPTITFTQGIASSISIAAYVTDSDNDLLTIVKNSAALPAGVTYDSATKSFVYDGIGGVGSTEGHILTASDR